MRKGYVESSRYRWVRTVTIFLWGMFVGVAASIAMVELARSAHASSAVYVQTTAKCNVLGCNRSTI